MLNRAKRLMVVCTVAASAAALVPTSPAAAASPCQGRSLFTFDWTQSVAVAGAYTSAGATDVQLTCGIVRNGVTVARFSENAPGPVAAVAGTTTISAGSFSVCYEIRTTYVDRAPTWSDNCP